MDRRQVRDLLPINGEDLERAERLLALGYPAVIPALRDMMRMMRIAESPVADAFARFFADLGAPAIEVIGEGLRKDNCWLKHRILEVVLPRWPADVVAVLRNDLTMAATHPDAYDNDVRCIVLLASLGLVEREWLTGWLEFERKALETRTELLRRAEVLLEER